MMVFLAARGSFCFAIVIKIVGHVTDILNFVTLRGRFILLLLALHCCS